MKKLLVLCPIVLAMVVLLSACGDAATTEPETICGDGICSGGEDENSCEADCGVELEVMPTETLAPTPTEEVDPIGYVTFAIYVSDFVHHDQSAETVLNLINLFESRRMRGEFYLTGPITHVFAQYHGEVIDRLRESDMAVSYHVIPPHPLIGEFQAPILNLPIDKTGRMITRYENERLDLETGGLDPEEPGGYNYLKELFGSPPLAVDAPKTSRTGYAMPILAQMGARMVVLPNEYDQGQPYKWLYSMLVRPADLTVNRWQVEGVEGAKAWWEMQESEFSASYNPRDRLQAQAEGWDAERLPFILVPMNEYSFYRSGLAPWTLIYYQDVQRSGVNSPPFDLNAPDPSTARSESDGNAVWEAYTRMAEWASVYLEPVTSEEVLHIAEGS